MPDVNKIYVFEGYKEGRLLNLSRDLDKLEEALEQDREIKLIVIDPLSAYLGRIDTHRDSDVRQTLAPLSFLAEKYRVAIVGIIHLNKQTIMQALYRVSGSVGFTASARSVWIIAWDRDVEKRRFFMPLKNNLSEDIITNLAFSIEDGKVVFEEVPVKDLDIQEILAPSERAGETKRARKFLLETLKDGAMPTTELQRLARDEGISIGTLRNAKRKLGGVRAVKGRGESGGKWCWELNEMTRFQMLTREGIPVDAKEKAEAVIAEHKKTEEKPPDAEKSGT